MLDKGRSRGHVWGEAMMFGERGVRAGLAVMLTFMATPVAAHSTLVSSEPASGARLTESPTAFGLTFNEEAQVTSLRLHVEGGAEITAARRQDVTPRRSFRFDAPTLAPGPYRLEWRAISADGHPVGGVVRFRVLAP